MQSAPGSGPHPAGVEAMGSSLSVGARRPVREAPLGGPVPAGHEGGVAGWLRELAGEFLVMATRGKQGRRVYDPLYEAVTEGRKAKGYSACGDFGHWLMFRLGFRERWVNRKEHDGWRPGVNLSLLCATVAGGANKLAEAPRVGMVLDAGDVLVVNAHDPPRSHVVLVMDRRRLEHGLPVTTAEYGQFDAKYGRASGRSFERLLRVSTGGKVRLGNSTLDSVLSLDSVLEQAHDRMGEPADPELYYRNVVADAQRILLVQKPAMRGNDVTWCQEELAARAYRPGAIDGAFGPRSGAAVAAFNGDQGLDAVAIVAGLSWAALMGWHPSEDGTV